MKIIRADLDSANAALAKVAELKEYTNGIVASIEEFKASSPSNLEGEAWDKVLNTFTGHYTELLNYKNSLDNSFIDAAKSANDSLASFCDGFPGGEVDLDDDGEVHEKYVELRDAAKSNYNSWANSTEPDAETRAGSYYDEYKKYKEYVEYLEGLPGADSSANANLDSVSSQVTTLKSSSGTCL